MTRARLLMLSAIGCALYFTAAAKSAWAKPSYFVVEKDKEPVEIKDPKQIQAMSAVLDASSDALAAAMKSALGKSGPGLLPGTQLPEETKVAQLRSMCEGVRRTPALREKQNELLRGYPQLKGRLLLRKENPEGQTLGMMMTESYQMGSCDTVCQDAEELAKKLPALKQAANKRSQELLRSVANELAFAQRFLALQLKGECTRAYAMTGQFYHEMQSEADFVKECKARKNKYNRYDVVGAEQDEATGLMLRFQGAGKKKYAGDLQLFVKPKPDSGPAGAAAESYYIGGAMNGESDN